jgi:hypothetical protein
MKFNLVVIARILGYHFLLLSSYSGHVYIQDKVKVDIFLSSFLHIISKVVVDYKHRSRIYLP